MGISTYQFWPLRLNLHRRQGREWLEGWDDVMEGGSCIPKGSHHTTALVPGLWNFSTFTLLNPKDVRQ